MVGACSQQLEVERTLWNPLSPGSQLMDQGTILSSCREALTLIGRGVRIAVTDLTPFLLIQPMGDRQLSPRSPTGLPASPSPPSTTSLKDADLEVGGGGSGRGPCCRAHRYATAVLHHRGWILESPTSTSPITAISSSTLLGISFRYCDLKLWNGTVEAFSFRDFIHSAALESFTVASSSINLKVLILFNSNRVLSFVLSEPFKRLSLCIYWVCVICLSVLFVYDISKNSRVEREFF
ncbi:hypothetical protein PIB30_022594 [Stylosanthes scabra]|uniref:Uncharacterized protein n=1 Tax=Stylosanthes scabra TaxID=79078 RepID=A0ABU6Q9I3_9FABA|nr:hypothetical protein [Stylosanthes scabra]